MNSNKFLIPEHIRQGLSEADAFDALMHLSGKVFRDVKGRKTMQVEIAGNSYFIKQHFGIGWGELVKNLLNLKKPVLGAMTEVQAIRALNKIDIPTTPLFAYGIKGWNPARQQSFVITEDLGDIVTLEEVFTDWKNSPPEPGYKQSVIIAMARLAAKLHRSGLCHRDFYLCHIVMKRADLMRAATNLILLDLHRMLFNQAHDGSAALKDIAGLRFSTMDCGFTQEDWEAFKQHYLPQSKAFWIKVEKRANKLYKKFHSHKFQQKLISEKSHLN